MTEKIRAITQANRASWNKIAAERHGDPAVFYHAGGVSLADFERELAGDVEGKRVLTLACSSGDQVLSWANRPLHKNASGLVQESSQSAATKATHGWI